MSNRMSILFDIPLLYILRTPSGLSRGNPHPRRRVWTAMWQHSVRSSRREVWRSAQSELVGTFSPITLGPLRDYTYFLVVGKK